MPLTENTIIQARIEEGQSNQLRQKYVDKDRDYIRRFKDPSLAYGSVGSDDEEIGSVPDDQAEGDIPYVATNVRTKLASICFTTPDFYAETEDPTLAGIPRQVLKTMWEGRNWSRFCEKAYLNRVVTGMGAVCVYWRAPNANAMDGSPTVEFVRISDWIVDPHVTDWTDLRWGARKIRMPKDEARTAWPDIFNEDSGGGGSDAKKSTAVDIWVYWDKTTEAAFFGKKLLYKDDNLYERVPIVFIEGDIDLATEWSLGDYDATAGLQQMATKTDDIINNAAKHGGATLLLNPDSFTPLTVEAITNGKQQGPWWVDGGHFDEAAKYLTAEPINPSVPMVQERVSNAIDAVTGVNQYMRGVVANSAKFATEVAATEGQSGARGSKAQEEYEQFLTRIANLIVQWIVKFGKPQSPEEFTMMEALSSVTCLYVVKGSSTYKNPVSQQQAATQLLQVLAPLAPITGMNLRPLVEKVLRAFGEQDMNQYFGPPSPQMADQGGMPGQAQPTPPDAGATGGVGIGTPPTAQPQLGGVQ